MNQSVFPGNAVRVFPKIGGTPPKWMVKIMENPIKMDDLGVPIIFGNIHKGFVCVPVEAKLSFCKVSFFTWQSMHGILLVYLWIATRGLYVLATGAGVVRSWCWVTYCELL